MKRGVSNIHGLDDFPIETQSSIRVGDPSRKKNSRGNKYFAFGLFKYNFDCICQINLF